MFQINWIFYIMPWFLIDYEWIFTFKPQYIMWILGKIIGHTRASDFTSTDICWWSEQASENKK